MLELYNYFFKTNKKCHQYSKFPIKLDTFCRIVKLSVIGIEFRDKLLSKQSVPMLLGHSNQPACNEQLQKMSASSTFTEVTKYIEILNSERISTFKLLKKEFEQPNILRKRCTELL